MKYFKVRTGFGKDEYVTIDETDYNRALKAQITGMVLLTKEGSISGNIIQKIEPDWNKEMGYNRDYQLTGEDYLYIGDKKQKEYRDFMYEAKMAVDRQLSSGNDKKLLK